MLNFGLRKILAYTLTATVGKYCMDFLKGLTDKNASDLLPQ